MAIVLSVVGLVLLGFGVLWLVAYAYGHPSYPLKNAGVFRRHSP